MFNFGTVQTVNVDVQCPPWYKHNVEYKFISEVNQPMPQVSYDCIPCGDNYYTPSDTSNTIFYQSVENVSSHQSKALAEPAENCLKCPYGAVCSGNDVMARPNYWGFWDDHQLAFQQCPAGHCCSGSASDPCKKFSSCAKNRTGVLCGSCEQGFSVAILSGKCTPDFDCGHNQWFWLLAILGSMAYAMWYTFKDDIFKHFFGLKKCLVQKIKYKTQSEAKVSGLNLSSSVIRNSNEGVDKGYFGILTYYVQMASAIKIHIEFSDVNNTESFTDKVVSSLGRFLNFELKQLSYNICPILGLTTLGKQIYQVLFLSCIFISWGVMFGLCHITLRMVKHRTMLEIIEHLELKLVKGMVEIIKYTYSAFCGILFMSLVCVQIGDKYVWWYDGTEVCFENWQVLVVLFVLLYAAPFPFVLFMGMKLLKQGRITAANFVTCTCLFFPLLSLLYWSTCVKEANSKPACNSKASESIVSVLQGPYIEDNKHRTLYWESMISVRRLLITAMTLVSYASIRMTIITLLSVIFLLQHIYCSPFFMKTSNNVETFSLTLLLFTSVINLLKANLTDSGVIPSGPSVPFFQGIEFCEKIFVILLIVYIVVIEMKLHKDKRSTSY